LERAGHTVTILDAEPEALDISRVLERVRAIRPDVLGVTATTPEFHRADELCHRVKGALPDTLIVMGGAHVSALPDDSLHDWIDYVVVGEGEDAMTHILSDSPRERVVCHHDADLSQSTPARHLLDYANYHYPHPAKGMLRMDVIESSRGCPFRCGFCYNRQRPTRYKEPGQVVEEIAQSWAYNGARFFMFLDDTLTVNRSHILALCEEIIKADLPRHVAFYGNARANCAWPDVLGIMRRANFVELSLGVESGDQAILAGVSKGTCLDEYRQAYQTMHQLGFQTRGSFILGLPGETHASARRTIDFAKELDLMRASCNVLTPYPGTELLERARNGDGLRLLTDDWRQFKRWGDCVIETDELTRDDLLYYQRQFLTEFYTQPKVLRYHAGQWLRGNRSRYYYRPLLFGLRERLRVNHVRSN
jgi:radical SAM superfamily enzyme YgiQ (UPF0313 family)